MRPGLIAGTIFVVTIGTATLIFWYLASTTGLVNLSEGALYLIRSVGLAGLLIGAVGLFIVLSAFRRAAFPIADVLAAIERVAAGEYDIEVGEQGPREIRALTRTFNAMADQLRQREETENELAASTAQELGRLFGRLRETLESLNSDQDERLEIALEQSNQLSRFVQDLNTLALAKSRKLTLARETTDLGVLVRDAMAGLHRDASARGVALRADIPDPAPIHAIDPSHFRQILESLLVNALARSASGDEIQVDLSESSKPLRVLVSVTDHGGEIPLAKLKSIFEQLRRRNGIGTGLELVIAKQLVQVQGGEVFATSDIEHGTCVTFVLPPDAPPS